MAQNSDWKLYGARLGDSRCASIGAAGLFVNFCLSGFRFSAGVGQS